MKKASPTQKTMAYLRQRGIACAVTEKYIAAIKCRKDCFGGDILALLDDVTLNIQAGIGSMHGAKVTYAKSHPEVRQWLSSSHRWFQVWTWEKKEIGKRMRWMPRVTMLTLVNGEIVAAPFILRDNVPVARTRKQS